MKSPLGFPNESEPELKFSCPNCNQNFLTNSSQVGLEIECPTCQQKLVIPTIEPANANPLGSQKLSDPEAAATQSVEGATLLANNSVPPPLPVPGSPIRFTTRLWVRRAGFPWGKNQPVLSVGTEVVAMLASHALILVRSRDPLRGLLCVLVGLLSLGPLFMAVLPVNNSKRIMGIALLVFGTVPALIAILRFIKDEQWVFPLSRIFNVQTNSRMVLPRPYRMSRPQAGVSFAFASTPSADGSSKPYSFVTLVPNNAADLARLSDALPTARVDLVDPYSQQAAEIAEFQKAIVAETPTVWTTWTLMGLNLLVFVIMTCAGVSIVTPPIPTLVDWGANHGPLTTCGQWWRLIT